MSTKAQVFQTLLAGIEFDGIPAASHVAYFVTSGTGPSIASLKSIYLDGNKSTPAVNPYTLDADGRAEVYLDGAYDVVIKTSVGGTVKAVWNVMITPDVLAGLNPDRRNASGGDVNVAIVAANDPSAVVRCIGKTKADTSANYVIITPDGGTTDSMTDYRINNSGEYRIFIPIPEDNDYLVI